MLVQKTRLQLLQSLAVVARVSCALRNRGRAARGPTDIKWDLFVLIANGERASDSLTDDQSSKPCRLEDHEGSTNVTEVYFHSFSVSVHPGFSGVGTTLCLGGPLERFCVLASGCVCGCAHGKRSFSKRLPRLKVCLLLSCLPR